MNDRIDEWIEGPPRGAKSLQQFASGAGQAGGKWDAERDGEGTQLRFSRGTPNFRWTGYCVRDAHKARQERRRFMRQLGLSDRRWVAGFEGKSVTASLGLRRKAILAHVRRNLASQAPRAVV